MRNIQNINSMYNKYNISRLKKPDGFVVPVFTRKCERSKSLDKTINKTTKFEDIIQNINDDRYAYQDGCIPRDLHIDNPDNGELASVKIISSLCKYTHATRTYIKCHYLFYLVFSFQHILMPINYMQRY